MRVYILPIHHPAYITIVHEAQLAVVIAPPEIQKAIFCACHGEATPTCDRHCCFIRQLAHHDVRNRMLLTVSTTCAIQTVVER